MSMPGFGAEASLYQTTRSYRSTRSWTDPDGGSSVSPQLLSCPRKGCGRCVPDPESSRGATADTSVTALLCKLSSRDSVLRHKVLSAGTSMLPERAALLPGGGTLLQRQSRLLPEWNDVQKLPRH